MFNSDSANGNQQKRNIIDILIKENMLTLHLAPIFKARNIERPFTFLVKSGFTTASAHRIINNASESIRLKHVEQLCKILVCEPSDLFAWKAAAGEKFETDFPLSRLIPEKEETDLSQTLATMPLRQLKSLTKTILNKDSRQGS
jgi:DNA-binding Xre family transcriptional regulator